MMNNFSLDVDNSSLFADFCSFDVPVDVSGARIFSFDGEISDDFRINVKYRYAKLEEEYHACASALRELLKQNKEITKRLAAIGDAVFRLGGWLKTM